MKLKNADGLNLTAKGTNPHKGDITGSVSNDEQELQEVRTRELTYVQLEAKKVLAKGTTATLTYTTAGLVTSKIELENVAADGFKAEIISNFNPKEGFNKGQSVNLHFKQGPAHVRAFSDFTPSTGAIIARVDGVASHEGFLVGGEAAYDVQKAALTRYSVGLGYKTAQYSLAATGTHNLNILSALYYHKVNAAVEASVKASYDVKESKPAGIEIASKYQVDPLSFVKVRFPAQQFMDEATMLTRSSLI